jgi:hypothetical protein
MQIISEHLLWNDVIESDGKVHQEETALGAALAVIIFVAAIVFFVSVL